MSVTLNAVSRATNYCTMSVNIDVEKDSCKRCVEHECFFFDVYIFCLDR